MSKIAAVALVLGNVDIRLNGNQREVFAENKVCLGVGRRSRVEVL